MAKKAAGFGCGLASVCGGAAHWFGGADPAQEGSFTIVVIPDTHVGREGLDELFDTQTRWIVDHLESQRIVFSGDQSRTETKDRKDIGDNGNTVHALMSDYRGVLRLYRFFPADQKLQVITYETTNGHLVTGTRLVPKEE